MSCEKISGRILAAPCRICNEYPAIVHVVYQGFYCERRCLTAHSMPKTKATPKLLEKDIVKTCVAWMELDGWRPFKTEPISSKEWGKGTGELGQADYLFIRYGQERAGDVIAEVIWIEFKRPGGKAKANQKAWHRAERARGALTLIAGEDFPASIEGFQKWYMESGLNRRMRLDKRPTGA